MSEIEERRHCYAAGRFIGLALTGLDGVEVIRGGSTEAPQAGPKLGCKGVDRDAQEVPGFDRSKA